MEELPFIWKVFMQDDQKDPLPICANNNLKVPLWLGSHSWIFIKITLEKTTQKAKNTQSQ